MFILKQANLELPLDMGIPRPTQHTTSSVPYPREVFSERLGEQDVGASTNGTRKIGAVVAYIGVSES